MFRTQKFALILGLAAVAGLPLSTAAQKDPDAAGVAAAIRFQKAEDAAAARQARLDTGHGGQASSADRVPTTATTAQKESGVEAALRFQRAEDAAAARQARLDAGRESDVNSADRVAPAPKAKTNRTTSASARKTPPPQH